MKSHSWQYVDKKKLVPLLFLAGVQQGLTALGTYALIKAGYSVGVGQMFLFWIAIALATQFLSPMVSVLVRPLEIKLTFAAYKKFLDQKLFFKAGNPSIWAQKNKKEVFLASIGGETDSYLGAILFVVLDVFSFFLSLVLGVLVLGATLDVSFVPAFIVAGVLSYVIYSYSQKYVVRKNNEEQEARTDLGSFLLQSWENIFFKNKSVIRGYVECLNIKFKKAERNSVQATFWNESMVAILSTATAIPVFVAIFWMVSRDLNNTAALTALLVTIPRQINLLATFRNMFQSVASLIAFESKFETLIKNASLESEDLLPRITFQDISADQLDADVITGVMKATKGRITVRGKNGAGKSTLLLHLNDALDNSFYLPAHPQFFNQEGEQGESTGQKVMRHLESLVRSDAQHILLDEWDANLDSANLAKANKLIDLLSESKVVLEVRHRSQGS
ncbi:hypothetical protein [Bdellovibrio sp. HCB2-146]|uniref:hypothetical protein n=1 Tax=Bdellovibrio sp. HCB2-146 TaxID=3394362 RepID=UPI0039BC762D